MKEHTYSFKNVVGLQEKVTELLNQTTREYQELTGALETAFQTLEFKTVQLDQLIEEVSVKEKITPEKVYRLLGVRWWGEGVFVRENKVGSEIKGNALYKVSSGWIIYNRLFAFRGSFAIVEPEFDQCHVSGEFPTFTIRSNAEFPEYLRQYIVHCLNSPQYLDIIDALSTGSTKTSRNRLNQKQFLQLEIQIPTLSENIIQLVNLFNKAQLVRAHQQELLGRMSTLKEGISRMLPVPSGKHERPKTPSEKPQRAALLPFDVA